VLVALLSILLLFPVVFAFGLGFGRGETHYWLRLDVEDEVGNLIDGNGWEWMGMEWNGREEGAGEGGGRDRESLSTYP